MRKSRFRARVESLEHREVLSGVHPAAMSDPLVELQARGRGEFISQRAIPNGSYQTVSALRGRSRALGHFTGQLVIDYASDQFRVLAGQAVLVGQGGDELFTSFRGAFDVPRTGAPNTPGRFKFRVVGGTGAFAGATGEGHIKILRNLEIGFSRINVHGGVHTH